MKKLLSLCLVLFLSVAGIATDRPFIKDGSEGVILNTGIGAGFITNIAELSNGNYAIGYTYRSSGYEAYIVIVDSNYTTVVDPFQVADTTTGIQSDPQIVAGDGEFIVYYESDEDSDGSRGIRKKTFTNAGVSQGSGTRVNSNQSGYQAVPRAVKLSSNTHEAFFVDASGGGNARFAATNGVVMNHAAGGISQLGPSVSDSEILVASIQYQFSNSNYHIRFQRLDHSRNKIGGQVTVTSVPQSSYYVTYVDSAYLTDGSYVVVWDQKMSSSPFTSELKGRIYDSGGNPGSIFTINTDSIQQRPIKIEPLENGNFIAVYTTSASGYNVSFQQIDSSGNKVFAEQVINATLGQKEWSYFKDLGNNEFLVAWRGYDVSHGGFYIGTQKMTLKPTEYNIDSGSSSTIAENLDVAEVNINGQGTLASGITMETTTLNVGDELTVRGTVSANTVAVSGWRGMSLEKGSTVTAETLTISSLSNVEVNGGVFKPTTVSGGTLISNGGTFAPENVNVTTLTMQGSTTVSPGNSPGRMTITGDMDLGKDVTTYIELGGGTAATGFDQLKVTGTLDAGGILQLALIDSYAPTVVGTKFKILDAGTLTGTFDEIYLPTTNGTIGFKTSDLYTTGEIEIVDLSARDSDGDGVNDHLDYADHDESIAFGESYPSEADTMATLAFEDNWPTIGDYDMNDMVIGYKFVTLKDSENDIVGIDALFNVRAVGALREHGFGIEFPELTAGQISSAILKKDGKTVSGYTAESGQTNPTYIIFHRIFAEMGRSKDFINTESTNSEDVGYSDLPVYKLEIRFGTPIAGGTDIGKAPYNPFIYESAIRGREIHLPYKSPTSLADASLFGTAEDTGTTNVSTTYTTIATGNYSAGLPWAIDIPEEWDTPLEKEDIAASYPDIVNWANNVTFQSGVNGGTWTAASHGTWYKTNATSGKVRTRKAQMKSIDQSKHKGRFGFSF